MSSDGRPRATPDGGLDLGDGRVVAARDVHLRATTSNGPGGQHANRTLSRVVATLDVAHCHSLSARDRARLAEQLGPLISASASSDRGQARNRAAALERLARKVHDGLAEDAPRTATRPTRASVRRRLDDKRRRATTKSERRRTSDD